jgi:hypothetical protein
MNISPRRRYRWLVLVPLLLALVNCAGVREAVLPPVQLWQIAREVPGADPRWQRADAATAGVRVWRGGREIAVQRLMELLPGDEIETGANAAAVLRFRDAGDTLVLERTRVRIGSLEVIFGRMFALLRNRFTVTSETVVAGVEGTRFLFEVGRDRAVRVAVADGAVVCRSPQDAWAPVRLQANEALLSRYPSRAPPMRTAADASELRAYEQLSRDVSSAPEQGWCCRDGQVSASWSNRCTGSFDTDRADAVRQCRPVPPPDPVGWCCSDGRVTRSTRSQCAGQFFDSEARAAACYPRPPQPPAGTPRDPTKRY